MASNAMTVAEKNPQMRIVDVSATTSFCDWNSIKPLKGLPRWFICIPDGGAAMVNAIWAKIQSVYKGKAISASDLNAYGNYSLVYKLEDGIDGTNR